MKKAIVFAAAMLLSVGAFAQNDLKKVNDVIEPLPGGSVTFNGYSPMTSRVQLTVGSKA